jgi:GT2 family glycosyltransferase
MGQQINLRFAAADSELLPPRQLIHQLNQRYRSEFDRAEYLRAELEDIKCSRAWRLCSWLRRWNRRIRSPLAPAAPAVAVSEVKVLTDVPATGAGRVSVVIPFKDQMELLVACLASLARSDPGPDELLLVDNGSRDPELLDFLRQWACRPCCRLLSCPGPFNFARLCNVGARQATGDHLLFLNNDIEVLNPDWLGEMLRVAAHPLVGIVGATLLYPDGTIQHAGLLYEAGEWVQAYRGWPLQDVRGVPELSAIRMVPAVTGACLLIRRDLFWQLEGFDKRYPTAFNDVDLCLRALRLGRRVAITPHAQLLHYESLSRGYAVERWSA